MSIQVVDPLMDRRWDHLVERHPKASVFHKTDWLRALYQTYGYKPFVLTTAAPDETMNDGMVLCTISSWATGTRAVSLPFADHCEPLANDSSGILDYFNWLLAARAQQKWRYVEIRPLFPFGFVGRELQPSSSYSIHELDIQPSLELLFHHMHGNCIRRKVRRAEKEGLSYQVGRGPELMEEFYQLLLITRRRLGILPQPRSWFRNLLECMGEHLQIRVARKNGVPIASILTLSHGRSVVYKYGCSNAEFHKLGGMPFLFWRLIEESKAWGAARVDFGRTDLQNAGLIRFKDRLGAEKSEFTYYRYPGGKRGLDKTSRSGAVSRLVSVLPDSICEVAGRVLYRHVG